MAWHRAKIKFMKYAVIIFSCLFLSGPAQAFLTSSDPDNFFLLLEKAPLVLVAVPESSKPPVSERLFYLHPLKKAEVLRGEAPADRLRVAEEILLPGQKSLFVEAKESLVFLAPLPAYTAYQSLREQGYLWRVYGGKNGVWLGGNPLALARAYLAASGREREAILLKTLQDPASRLRHDAILTLERGEKISLSTEQAETLLNLARGDSGETGLAAVRVLAKSDNEVSRAALQKLASAPSSATKWTAIRALESKGQVRALSVLVEDYQAADAAGRSQALTLIAARKNSEAQSFFNSLLSGSTSFDGKREAIHSMSSQKSPGYEKILLQQIGQAGEDIQAEAILALGKMNSAEAVSLILPLLDSPSAKLRGAAFFMLVESPDPRARAEISRRYERDHHGGWEKNPHFYGNPQPDR